MANDLAAADWCKPVSPVKGNASCAALDQSYSDRLIPPGVKKKEKKLLLFDPSDCRLCLMFQGRPQMISVSGNGTLCQSFSTKRPEMDSKPPSARSSLGDRRW